MKIGIINSGSYISGNLREDVGLIPPSFLPAGKGVLLRRQVGMLKKCCEKIILSIPGDFVDERGFLGGGIHVVRNQYVELGKSAAHSLLVALELGATEVAMLHGDTLLEMGPGEEFDFNAIYLVEELHRDVRFQKFSCGGKDGYAAGAYGISDAHFFLRGLLQNDFDFEKTCVTYYKEGGRGAVHAKKHRDYGNLLTIFDSLAENIDTRFVNRCRVEGGVFYKTGPREKIEKEAGWYENLPLPLKKYTVPYYGKLMRDGELFYALEKQNNFTLAHAFVYGNMALRVWRKIFDNVQDFLRDSMNPEVLNGAGNSGGAAKAGPGWIAWYKGKTRDRTLRAEKIMAEYGVPKRCVHRHISAFSDAHQNGVADKFRPAYMHGDFCFSNMFWDARMETIKLIDPRGLREPGPALGNFHYDVYKLAHSVLCKYDYIKHDIFALGGDWQNGEIEFPRIRSHSDIEQLFADMIAGFHIAPADVLLGAAELFLTMIPLHTDKPHHVKAMWAVFCQTTGRAAGERA